MQASQSQQLYTAGVVHSYARGHFILTLQLQCVVFICQGQEACQVRLLLSISLVEVEDEILEGLLLHLWQGNPPGPCWHVGCQHFFEH